MKLTYLKFLKYGIDLAPLGLEQRTGDETYFCTPKGAKVIGWAGVDGDSAILLYSRVWRDGVCRQPHECCTRLCSSSGAEFF